MSAQTTKIDVRCGIYDSEYTIRDYGDKITVKAPYIKWVDNSGNLDFVTTTVTHIAAMRVLRYMVEEDCLITDDGETIQDILDGNYAHIPIK